MRTFIPSALARPLVVLLALLATVTASFAAGLTASGDIGGDYTQTDVVLLVLYVLLALSFSFLCSVAEAVLLSVTPSFIAGLETDRPKQAGLLKQLKQDNVDRSLAAILTLNTIAHTVGAIGAGAKATIVFGSAYFGVFSAVMTLLILFLSEIIPKTLGAVWWRALAAPTAYFVKSLILVLYPLIVISEQITRLIGRGRNVHVFNREEFVAMASIGGASGHLHEDETRIIHNLFALRSLTADDVMTPRTVIHALQQDRTVSDALPDCANSPFSRLPLFAADFDEITGFVLKDDLLLTEARDQGQTPLSRLRREIHPVPKTEKLSHLLEFLLDRRAHLAVVVDEYGGTAGLVSLEDVVETLLGIEIVDEADRTQDMRKLARKRWKERAAALGVDPGADESPSPESENSRVNPRPDKPQQGGKD
jgi:CBS domain containing-hemolysin-like protein